MYDSGVVKQLYKHARISKKGVGGGRKEIFPPTLFPTHLNQHPCSLPRSLSPSQTSRDLDAFPFDDVAFQLSQTDVDSRM